MDLVDGRFPRGKHAGKTFDWVWSNDRPYLDWLSENGVLGKSIREALEKRDRLVPGGRVNAAVRVSGQIAAVAELPRGTARQHLPPVRVNWNAAAEQDLAEARDQVRQLTERLRRMEEARTRAGEAEEALRRQLREVSEERNLLAIKVERESVRPRPVVAEGSASTLGDVRRQLASKDQEIETLRSERAALAKALREAPRSTPPDVEQTHSAITRLVEERLKDCGVATLAQFRRWCTDSGSHPKLVLLESRAAVEKLILDTLDRMKWVPPEGERITFRKRVQVLRERGVLTEEAAEWVMAVWGVGSSAAHGVTQDAWTDLDAYAMVLIVARILRTATRASSGRVGSN
jgi:hypothetical protein